MILLDTNVVSEPLRPRPEAVVLSWLTEHDPELALPAVAVAEVAYGIEKIRPAERATRLAVGLREWRQRFANRVIPFDEEAAMAYGKLMGRASRDGTKRSLQDGMIAAIAVVRGARVATRNTTDFDGLGVEVVNPWGS